MRFGKYHLQIRFEEKALLPPYLGSMLRGAFGAALKTAMCGSLHRDCQDCRISPRCLYAQTFEAVPQGGREGDKRLTPPNPYVMEPPIEPRARFEAGDILGFNLLLFGKANEFLPFFLHAFELMGRRGVGRSMEGPGGATFSLVSMSQNDDLNVYDPETGRLLVEPSNASLSVASPETLSEGELKIWLKTPLRLKYMNQLQDELPFHVLVRAMLRRISSLFGRHGSGEPEMDYRGLVSRAGTVETSDSEFRWHDWERFSNRQKRRMLLGGLVGSATYAGVNGEYLPLLDLAKVLHIGKQTTFGLGLIDFEWKEKVP